MATETRARPEDASAEPKRRFRFPTAFTVLFFVLVLVWILTFIIKPGSYSYVSCYGASPKPIPGTFENVGQNLSIQERLYDLWLSPVNGLYGIRTPAEVVSDPGSKLLKKAEAACGTTDGKQVMYLVNVPLAFLVPSSSGHATLAMPIMAPLGDFAGVSRAMVVTAYQSASGWMNLFTPTSAIVMGGLALSRVRYDRYLRFLAPLLGARPANLHPPVGEVLPVCRAGISGRSGLGPGGGGHRAR